jgi:ABC-type uncharacterized transport system ATPase subunit
MICAENVVKKFGSFTALQNLTCKIPEGTVYGLVGSNGAGKIHVYEADYRHLQARERRDYN